MVPGPSIWLLANASAEQKGQMRVRASNGPQEVGPALPAHARCYLDHCRDLIERSEAELDVDRQGGVGVTSYWDP